MLALPTPLARCSLRRRLQTRAVRTPVATATTDTKIDTALAKRAADFVPPEPKRFSVSSFDQVPALATAAASFLFRGTFGAVVAGYGVSGFVPDRPEAYSVQRTGDGKMLSETSSVIAGLNRPRLPLELYEFESCPFCKRVREGIVHYDLDVTVYPCPQGGPNWRPKAIALGGKRQFPLLVDPNSQKDGSPLLVYESADIITYLATLYGDSNPPGSLLSGFAPLLLGLSLMPRLGRGGRYRASRVTPSTQPLIYWGYEASPFCKIVREVLGELEIPHVWKTTARGSPTRDELFAKTGRFQVPYIEDPNTGVSTFESAAIVKYLEQVYAIV